MTKRTERLGRLRKIAALMLWCCSAALIIAFLAGWLEPRADPSNYVPALGSELDLESIESQFGLRNREHGAVWFLVVTSSCPACLALDHELMSIQAAARCAEAAVIPLVIETGLPLDSIRAVLQVAGLTLEGSGTPQGFHELRVRSVPAVVGVDPMGVVKFTAHPSLPDWPPQATC